MIDRQAGYRGSNTMREMVQDNNFLLHVISRFDIAYGFGDESILKICDANGVHAPTFLSVCNLISGYPYSTDDVHLESLIGYLRHAHRTIAEITLPHIRHHLVEGVTHTSAGRISEMLVRFFDEYTAEVCQHMKKEEEGVFRYAERLLDGEVARDRAALDGYTSHHEPVAQKLRELKDIFIYHYAQHDNDRLSAVLFDIILCERDLTTHFDVENRLLIPVINATVRGNRKAKVTPGATTEAAELLGLREKEILCRIALGLTNKQIADAMCISVHTVATHRRNICAKLDIHTGSGLTLYAIVNGLIDITSVSPG